MTVDFKIDLATPNDADALIDMFYPAYFDESGYSKLTYDEVNSRITLSSWLSDNCCIKVTSNDKIVAFASMGFMRSFYKEIEADVTMFYITKDYRGSGISRAMCDKLVKIAEEYGAQVMYSSCFSGMDEKNNNIFINLWKKYGFRVLGTVLIRS
jgi:ribosomal protein S18 acetylase RimI-like enzyme